jgi:hypothetical protein
MWHLRRLVAGLSPRRSGFDPGSVYVGFVVGKWHWDRFFSEYFGFPLSISFHRCSFKMEKQEKPHHLHHLPHVVAQ